MEKTISTQLELYNKLKPALRTKKHELFRAGLRTIGENDIWNYNKENRWKTAKGLTIAAMVDDILNTPLAEYDNYMVKKLAEKPSKPNLKG